MAFLNIEVSFAKHRWFPAPRIRAGHASRRRRSGVRVFDAGLKARMPRASEFAGAPAILLPETCTIRPRIRQASTRGLLKGTFAVVPKDAMPLPGGDPRRWCTRRMWTSISDGASRTPGGSNNVFRPGHKTNQSLVYAPTRRHSSAIHLIRRRRRRCARCRYCDPCPPRHPSPPTPVAHIGSGKVRRRAHAQSNLGRPSDMPPVNSPAWKVRPVRASRGPNRDRAIDLPGMPVAADRNIRVAEEAILNLRRRGPATARPSAASTLPVT